MKLRTVYEELGYDLGSIGNDRALCSDRAGTEQDTGAEDWTNDQVRCERVPSVGVPGGRSADFEFQPSASS